MARYNRRSKRTRRQRNGSRKKYHAGGSVTAVSNAVHNASVGPNPGQLNVNDLVHATSHIVGGVPGTSCEPVGIIDCNGHCLEYGMYYLEYSAGDDFCDQAFNCAAFNYDGGDCAGPGRNGGRTKRTKRGRMRSGGRVRRQNGGGTHPHNIRHIHDVWGANNTGVIGFTSPIAADTFFQDPTWNAANADQMPYTTGQHRHAGPISRRQMGGGRKQRGSRVLPKPWNGK